MTPRPAPGPRPGSPLRITVDGEPFEGVQGQTIAGILLSAGRLSWRRGPSGAPRGVFCGIGACFDCLLTVNGIPDVRACRRRATNGDTITTQSRTPNQPSDPPEPSPPTNPSTPEEPNGSAGPDTPVAPGAGGEAGAGGPPSTPGEPGGSVAPATPVAPSPGGEPSVGGALDTVGEPSGSAGPNAPVASGAGSELGTPGSSEGGESDESSPSGEDGRVRVAERAQGASETGKPSRSRKAVGSGEPDEAGEAR
ncbi:(2Fe-2S)-binding protein [Actinomadura sp. SCN-SB]|uniref:(2Fe-2S)-binding protein n=1 Tax=Actinomadura sp. SCN-SB TaxID=3373092 RepID=UPI0037538EDB